MLPARLVRSRSRRCPQEALRERRLCPRFASALAPHPSQNESTLSTSGPHRAHITNRVKRLGDLARGDADRDLPFPSVGVTPELAVWGPSPNTPNNDAATFY